MATQSIAKTARKVSDFLKKEFWVEERWCRVSGTVTVPAGGIEPGQVLTETGGKWVVPTSGFVAGGKVAIVVDETSVEKPAGDTKLGLLVKGPAIVTKKGLNYGEATAALVDAELVKAGIRVDA